MSNIFHPTSERLPEVCEPVIGYAAEWVDLEMNPRGFRECHRMDDGTWMSARWNNYQDCWDVDDATIPSHWMLPEVPL